MAEGKADQNGGGDSDEVSETVAQCPVNGVPIAPFNLVQKILHWVKEKVKPAKQKVATLDFALFGMAHPVSAQTRR